MDIDKDVLEVLKAQAKADDEANRLKQAEVNALRRREQMSLEEREATVKLRYEVQQLKTGLEQLSEEISATIGSQQLLVIQVKRLQELVEKIDDTMLLLLTEHSQQALQEAIEETSTRKLKRKYQRNLDKLKEQAAGYGSLEVPLSLQNKIEAEERKLEELDG